MECNSCGDAVHVPDGYEFEGLCWDCERNQLETELEQLRTERREIVAAFVEYRRTEGCNCCSDYDGHKAAEDRLGKLLGAPRYHDGSGWDWDKALASETDSE